MRFLRKKEKGQAGLDILLSVVTMLFMLGMIIMVFVYAGSKLEDSLGTPITTAIANETTSATVTEVAQNLAYAGNWDVACSGFVVTNATVGFTIASTNYTTTSACTIAFTGADTDVNNTYWNVTYSATYLSSSDAVEVINGTSDALSGVVDWFDIIIVMTALVVLILLIVLIIRAIRGTGVVGGA